MPAPPRAAARQARATLRRRLVGAFTQRLGLKASALTFALMLWVIVGSEEATQQLVDVQIALALDSGVALRGSVPPVRAWVTGRGRELLKLYAAPLTVRRAITPDVRDSILLQLSPGDIEVPNGVAASVTDVQPRSIPLRFDVTAERVVPVRSALRISMDSGLRAAGEPRFEPESVQVRGRRAAVNAVRAVPTSQITLVVRDTTLQVVTLDTSGLDVRVRPARVQVRVPLRHDTVAAGDSTRPPPRDSIARMPRRGPQP